MGDLKLLSLLFPCRTIPPHEGDSLLSDANASLLSPTDQMGDHESRSGGSSILNRPSIPGHRLDTREAAEATGQANMPG